MECCGKPLCNGCINTHVSVHLDAMRKAKKVINVGDPKTLARCPFCNIPTSLSKKDFIGRLRKRIDLYDDAIAMQRLGLYYIEGSNGLQKDTKKGIELYRQASERGYVSASASLGDLYFGREGIAKDMEKETYYLRLAAMGGDIVARHNLGVFEAEAHNYDLAFRHLMISAMGGCDNSLKCVRHGYTSGHVSKDDFEKALRAHQVSKDAMEASKQRDPFPERTRAETNELTDNYMIP